MERIRASAVLAPLLHPAALMSVVLVACSDRTSKRPPEEGPPDLGAVEAEVTAAVWAFHAADTARDAEAVISLLWPEYEMRVDGQRTTYAEVAAGSRAFMAGLRRFHTIWTDLEVIPLSSDLAISSFLFTDSIVSSSGEVTRSHGPTTFVWERRSGEWRVRFGDADHDPIGADSDAVR
jgi:ketosteroid isomerase-like protein